MQPHSVNTSSAESPIATPEAAFKDDPFTESMCLLVIVEISQPFRCFFDRFVRTGDRKPHDERVAKPSKRGLKVRRLEWTKNKAASLHPSLHLLFLFGSGHFRHRLDLQPKCESRKPQSVRLPAESRGAAFRIFARTASQCRGRLTKTSLRIEMW